MSVFKIGKMLFNKLDNQNILKGSGDELTQSVNTASLRVIEKIVFEQSPFF